MDMSAAYAKGVGMALPGAQISYDRFHVVAMAGEAMDEVRRAEMTADAAAVRPALGTGDKKTLKQLMWGMRRNPSGWSERQVNAMHWLQHSRLKSVRAWRLKMALQEVYARARLHSSLEQASTDLLAWMRWARRCRLEPFKKLADPQEPVCRRRARHDRPPLQRLRRGNERPAAAGQTRRPRLSHQRQLHRHRLPPLAKLKHLRVTRSDWQPRNEAVAFHTKRPGARKTGATSTKSVRLTLLATPKLKALPAPNPPAAGSASPSSYASAASEGKTTASCALQWQRRVNR